MGRLRSTWLRLRALVTAPPGDIDAELASHLQLHIDDNLRAGMPPAQARRDALLKIGGVEQTRQAWRDQRSQPALESLVRDILFSLRILKKTPGFTIIAVLTLALGIGANTALFSVVNGVLLNPLPYPHPEELLTVHAGKQNFPEGSISYLNFRDWQRDNNTLAALAVSRPTGYNLTGVGKAEEVRAELVSSSFFSILGTRPVLGRLFLPGEDEIGRAPLALISAGFWTRKFASSPDVIGKPLTLDGRSYTIIGVVPASFRLSLGSFRPSDIYVPIGQFQNPALNDRAAGLGIHGIARLKPGVTLAQAQSDMERVSQHLEQEYPTEDQGIRARLVPFQEALLRDVKSLLLVLLGAVGFVLLIACVNVANLFLVRSSARVREFAVRSALGAGRSRLVRQLLTESTLISLAGGTLGVLLAAAGTPTIIQLLPQALPRAEEIHLSAPVLLFTLIASLTSGILFGLAPAFSLFRKNLYPTLRESSRGAGGNSHRTQDWLVVAQMAMALVLLAGAGLLIRSLFKLSHVDPGFHADGAITFGLQAPPSLIGASLEAQRAYLRESERTIAAAPGIQAASLSWGALPMDQDDEQLFWFPGEAKPVSQNAAHMALLYIVGPGYLKAMGIPLLRGRFLSPNDDHRSGPVVVIDDVLARKYFGSADPIGKILYFDNHDDFRTQIPVTVVGVVGHVNQWGLDVDSTNSLRTELYLPIQQLPPVQLSLVPMGVDIVARTSLDQQAAFKSIQDSLARMDREQVVYNEQSMQSLIADTLAGRRFTMVLLIAFAIMALLLASIGMYGVIAYLVGQRTQEIGVRMALGAARGDIVRWVMARGARLALIGAATGLVLALALTEGIARSASSTLLFGVHAYDPWTMASVTLLLLVVAAMACALPARKAMRTDPMQALRTE